MRASLGARGGRATGTACVQDVAVQAPANVTISLCLSVFVCLFAALIIVDGHWSARQIISKIITIHAGKNGTLTPELARATA